MFNRFYTFRVIFLFALMLVVCSNFLYSQDVTIKKRDEAILDSLRDITYPYVLPIYGDKVQQRGHTLPLPFGIMTNYIAQRSELTIDDIALSLKGSEFVPMDFLEFDTVENIASVMNLRLEAWLFPFLNVYGIYARSESSNSIKLIAPFELDIPTRPTAETYGIGTVLAYGRGDYFAIANFNATWSDVSSLSKKVYGTVTSFRVGRSFGFRKKYHNINFSIAKECPTKIEPSQ